MRPDTLRLHIILWITLVAGVVLAGMYWIPREYPGLSFWERLYTIVRLFVFERDLPTFPKTWPVIFIHFAAPLITVSALGTVLTYLLKSSALRTLFLRDHVIICGAGRTGKLIAASLRRQGVAVALVDSGDPASFADWRREHRALLVSGDFHSLEVLRRAGIERCRSVVFASGDDLANIEGALCAHAALANCADRERVIWAHVAEDRLAATMAQAVPVGGAAPIRYFDTYHIAAEYMMKDCVPAKVLDAAERFTIIGFGKFGNDILEALAGRLGTKRRYRITVIDRSDLGDSVISLARSLGISARVKFMRRDIHMIETLRGGKDLYFLCTDDDLGNLTLALNLSERAAAAYIFVRMAHWPMQSVTEKIGEERGIVFVNINDLIDKGVRLLMG